jgi:hypothetical protein
MWLIDVEQNGLHVGSRVLIQDESEMNGLTGTICGEQHAETGEWPVRIEGQGSSTRQLSVLESNLHEIVINPQELLLASNGLYFQPYCASVPMPPSLLSRCVPPSSRHMVITSPHFAPRRFKLLGEMMAKALHDGRAFPLRISYALARCICGQQLDFDDLGGVLGRHRFHMLKRLRTLLASGSPISQKVWVENDFDCLDFTMNTIIVEKSCRGTMSDISKQLHLVRDGDKIDVTIENAAEYLRAVERMCPPLSFQRCVFVTSCACTSATALPCRSPRFARASIP